MAKQSLVSLIILALVALVINLQGASSACNCSTGQTCVFNHCVLDASHCPKPTPYGKGPPASCAGPTDPNKKPASKIESWFTAEIFNDLFPKANIGWGPNKCWPYSYESFVIAARYFPEFGSEAPNNGFTAEDNYRRDLAAFFSHAVQETGENDASLYASFGDSDKAAACFYRGGFYNWFEGGPVSSFLPPNAPGWDPKDGDKCIANARYCSPNTNFPCNNATDGQYFKGCYFGRGAIQISYNFNYGPFQQWLQTQGINVDLLTNPNLVMTYMNPPLAIMASLWFYMMPQPPKPAMHDIVMGIWKPDDIDAAAGYKGAIFGPTSLIINAECNGEDASNPGGPGESRRIKAYKWFSTYFGYRVEPDNLLTCKTMKKHFDTMQTNRSYGVEWSTSWKEDSPCRCEPHGYDDLAVYYAPGYYPQRFVDLNKQNYESCVKQMLASAPGTYGCQKYYGGGSSYQPQRPPQPTNNQATSNGNSGNQCTGAGYIYGDPKDCSVFYICQDATTAIKQQCAAGLEFHASLKVCDWPANANCKTQQQAANNNNAGSSKCTGAGFIYGDSKDCSVFYICQDASTAIKQTCAAGLQFNAALKVCDWPDNAKCKPTG